MRVERLERDEERAWRGGNEGAGVEGGLVRRSTRILA